MRYAKPNITSLSLMVASLLLLAAFQVFWLRKEYNEQKNSGSSGIIVCCL
jgi:hypothetical protein